MSGSGVKNVGFGPYFQHVNLSLARLQCQLLLVAQNFKDIFVLFPPLPLLLRQETKSHTLTSSTLKYKRFRSSKKQKLCKSYAKPERQHWWWAFGSYLNLWLRKLVNEGHTIVETGHDDVTMHASRVSGPNFRHGKCRQPTACLPMILNYSDEAIFRINSIWDCLKILEAKIPWFISRFPC